MVNTISTAPVISESGAVCVDLITSGNHLQL